MSKKVIGLIEKYTGSYADELEPRDSSATKKEVIFQPLETNGIPNQFSLDQVIFSDEEIDRDYVEKHREKYDKEVMRKGVDALAWYRSFHWKPNENNIWGIYIKQYGIEYLAAMFSLSKQSPSRSREMAFELLYLHEYFHYMTDVAASAMEILSQTAKYIPYFRKIYKKPNGFAEPVEEALANAYALREWRYPQVGVIRKFMADQGNGYGDYETYMDPDFFTGLDYLGNIINRSQEYPLISSLFDCDGRCVSRSDVPVHLVVSKSDSQKSPVVGFVKALDRSNYCETRDFQIELEKMTHDIQQDYLNAVRDMQIDVRRRFFKKIHTKRGQWFTFRFGPRNALRVLMVLEGGRFIAQRIVMRRELKETLRDMEL